MRLDRLITLNVVQPLHRACRGLDPRSSTPDRRLPILMYHSISADPESGVAPYYRTCTSPSRFREHLALLQSAGYQGVTLTAGLAWLNSQEICGPAVSVPAGVSSAFDLQPSTLAPRLVALTFDDGFRDFHTDAFPLLREFGFSATMYLPTAFIGDDRRPFHPRGRLPYPTDNTQLSRTRDCLTWSEVREMHSAGIEFGSHTVNHPKLVDLAWPEVESELRTSRLELQARLGAPVPAFAYPYAFPQADRNFADTFCQLLNRVGYETCVTTGVGRARPGADPLRLVRLPVNSEDDAALLTAKLVGYYDWLGAPQALVKRIKQAVRPSRTPTAVPGLCSVVNVR